MAIRITHFSNRVSQLNLFTLLPYVVACAETIAVSHSGSTLSVTSFSEVNKVLDGLRSEPAVAVRANWAMGGAV
jgi:hypothetical protein